MKKVIYTLALLVALGLSVICFSGSSNATTQTYTVQAGDSMWKIAVKYQVGVSEIISANPQIKNPNLIYVGQKIYVPTTPEITAIEKEVARLVNVERAKAGLPALSYNWQLARVARIKSEDMRNNNYFSHTSPTYGSPFTMMKNFGITYTAAGENIAMGQKTATQVMNSWMNSPGHRSNILNAKYTQIGVGVAKNSSGRIYWTQQFIRP